MKVAFVVAVLLLALSSSLGSPTANAQGVGTSADLTGTVSDPAGGSVPNAKVTVIDEARAVQRSVQTDEQGGYRFSGLAPATYRVTVEHSGFQSEAVKDVVLNVGQTLVLDFHLKLAGTTSTIEVSAASPLVEAERGSQANTLTQDYIAGLPIDRRDYLTFTLLAPGVSNSNNIADNADFRPKQTPQSGLSFYGSNGRGNSVTVDGGEANDDAGGVRLTISQDAVQEFQVNRTTTPRSSAELAARASTSFQSRAPTNCMAVCSGFSAMTRWMPAMFSPTVKRCSPATRFLFRRQESQ